MRSVRRRRRIDIKITRLYDFGTPPNGWVLSLIDSVWGHRLSQMKLRHYNHDGRARFVTFCTHLRIPLLTNRVFCEAVQSNLLSICAETGVDVLAYVLMPDHVHTVLVPPVGVKVGSLIGEIKRRSAKEIADHLRSGKSGLFKKLTVKRDGASRVAIWQRRCFDRNCRDEDEVWKTVEYCHSNPVSRGLVKEPGRWEWSSYSWYHEALVKQRVVE